jgi:hypothetical protein
MRQEVDIGSIKGGIRVTIVIKTKGNVLKS